MQISTSAFFSGLAAMCGATFAQTLPAADFYRTKPQIIIAYPSDEFLPRLLARHLPKHLPGSPNAIVQYIPAAGGLVLANQTYTTAPKNGTFLALIRGSTLQLGSNGDPAANFEGQRFAWIGNMTKEYDTCVVAEPAPIKSLNDIYEQELIFGASAAGSPSLTFPLVYNAILGTKFKVIRGYDRIGDRVLAMERGELMGGCGFYTNNLMSALREPFSKGKIKVLFQAGIGTDSRFPEAPNILDQAKSEADRQALQYMFATLELGRPFASAPETPPDRVALLRQAFDATMKDREFLEEANKMQVAMNTSTGDETAEAVERLYKAPKSVVDRVNAIVQQNK